MTDQEKPPETAQERASEAGDEPVKVERFPELAELGEEIDRRIRGNQRFLERFMDEDFDDEDDEQNEAEDEDDLTEEL